jgi:hypothetical protein
MILPGNIAEVNTKKYHLGTKGDVPYYFDPT